MSDVMNLIDEARRDRDRARQEAAQWAYIATLYALGDGAPIAPAGSRRWAKSKRDVEAYYLVPEEMKGGALKVVLMEAPEPEVDLTGLPDGT